MRRRVEHDALRDAVAKAAARDDVSGLQRKRPTSSIVSPCRLRNDAEADRNPNKTAAVRTRQPETVRRDGVEPEEGETVDGGPAVLVVGMEEAPGAVARAVRNAAWAE